MSDPISLAAARRARAVLRGDEHDGVRDGANERVMQALEILGTAFLDYVIEDLQKQKAEGPSGQQRRR